MKRLTRIAAVILAVMLTVSTVVYADDYDENTVYVCSDDTESSDVQQADENTDDPENSAENISDAENQTEDGTSEDAESGSTDSTSEDTESGSTDNTSEDTEGGTDGISEDTESGSTDSASEDAESGSTDSTSEDTEGGTDGTSENKEDDTNSDSDDTEDISDDTENGSTDSKEDKKEDAASEDKDDLSKTDNNDKSSGNTDKEQSDDQSEDEEGLTDESAEAMAAVGCTIDTSGINTAIGSGKIRITISSKISNLKSVKLAVWSQADQSDIYRYKASAGTDGTYVVRFARYFHNDNWGTYHASAYILLKDGTKQYLAETTFTVNEPSAPEMTVSKSGDKYVFRVSNIPNASQATSVVYKVWSDFGSKANAVWYTGSFNKYSLKSVLKSDLADVYYAGTYHVQAYYVLDSGTKVYFCGSTFEVERSYAYCTSMKVSKKKTSGKFTVTVGGITSPTGIGSVKVAVWSKDDQSDLVWYKAKKSSDGTYSFSSGISKHNYNIGTYYAHAYLFDKNGNATFLGYRTFSFQASSSGFDISENEDRMHYTATLSDLVFPGGIKKVEFAVWSDKNGQDDLGWYLAEGTNGGDFTATISIDNHKTPGLYYVHAYVTTKSNQTVMVGGTTFTVTGEASGTISVSGLDDGDGVFYAVVGITKASPAVSSVKVKVWNKDDPSNVVYYTPSLGADGKYTANINVADFSGRSGTYRIRAYVTLENGMQILIAKKSQYFSPDSYLAISSSNGTYTRTVAYKNTGISSAKFKVWSQRGGNKDSKYYEGQTSGDGIFYITVSMDDFCYDGKYNIKVYSGSTVLETASFIMIDYLEEGIAMANNDSIGYSQVHRNLNPDVDCSSFVYYALKNTGYSGLPSSPFSTYTEAAVLEAAGFTKYVFTSIDDLQVGDILLRHNSSSQHTEIYVGNGFTVGAHSDENGDIVGNLTGDQTGREVSVVTASDYWEYYFRYITYD